MRFFGDGGPKTIDKLLHNLAKHVFFECSSLKIGWGALHPTTQAPKTLFEAKKWYFLAIFWVKNAVFFVLAARKHFITCSNILRAMFFEARTQIQPVPFFMCSLGLHLVLPGLH